MAQGADIVAGTENHLGLRRRSVALLTALLRRLVGRCDRARSHLLPRLQSVENDGAVGHLVESDLGVERNALYLGVHGADDVKEPELVDRTIRFRQIDATPAAQVIGVGGRIFGLFLRIAAARRIHIWVGLGDVIRRGADGEDEAFRDLAVGKVDRNLFIVPANANVRFGEATDRVFGREVTASVSARRHDSPKIAVLRPGIARPNDEWHPRHPGTDDIKHPASQAPRRRGPVGSGDGNRSGRLYGPLERPRKDVSTEGLTV